MSFRVGLFLAATPCTLGVLGAAAPASAQVVTTYGYDTQGQLTAATQRSFLKPAPADYTFVPDNSGSRPVWPKPPVVDVSGSR
jgi:hypothetical protein